MASSKRELSFLTASKSSTAEAAAAERKRRDAEIEEMRRLKAEQGGTFETMRRELAEKAENGAPMTNMEDWRATQKGKAEDDRRKKMEANEHLHGYRGKELNDKLPKKDKKYQDQYRGIAPTSFRVKGGEALGGDEEFDEHNEFEANAPPNDTEDVEPELESEDLNSGEPAISDDNQHDDSPKNDPELANSDAQSEAPVEDVEPTVDEAEPIAEETTPVEEETAPVEIPASLPEPKTFSRTDVKFSFGLIVRSNGKENGFDGENLRDNETLRKCMAATAKILLGEMPSPPTEADLEGDGDNLPEAYYDPNLAPSVINIEEETTDKPLEINTKRTLVKASFPVFLRDGNTDEAGKEKSSRVLKETKSTVFKSLRAAVSGGSFLR